MGEGKRHESTCREAGGRDQKHLLSLRCTSWAPLLAGQELPTDSPVSSVGSQRFPKVPPRRDGGRKARAGRGQVP